MQRSNILPTTRRGPRPRGQHAGGEVDHGHTDRCRGHRLTDQPRGIAHAIGHARIEPLRSTYWAVVAESPTWASPTPPRPPPTKVATARTRIVLSCTVVIDHLEFLSCACVGSRHPDAAGRGPRLGDFIDTPTPDEGLALKNWWKIARVFFAVYAGRRRWEPSRVGMTWSRRATVFRNGALRSTALGSWPGRPRLRGHGLSDLTRLVESVDGQRRTRSWQRPPRRQEMRTGYSAYYIGHIPWERGDSRSVPARDSRR